MKLIKSLLLGSAAGLCVVAGGAQAADLPSRKAAPVEYVRICDAYGAGFFYIPGTDSCLQISGFLRAEYAFQTRSNAQVQGNFNTGAVTPVSQNNFDEDGFRARGRVNFDVRTQTAYGTLRTYVRFQITRDQDIYIGSSPSSTGLNRGNAATAPALDKGFIQFAGITAGRVQSFFDFYADGYNFDAIANSDASNNVLAYTATFGGGLTATISVEGRGDRTGALYGVGTLGSTLAGNAFNPGGTAFLPHDSSTGVLLGGNRVPDVVGQINLTQGWGQIQASGAVHQTTYVDGFTIAPTGFNNPPGGRGDSFGYAGQLGVMFNLPMLAAGDNLYLQGAYASGALDYIGFGPNSGNLSQTFFGGTTLGGVIRNDTDITVIRQPAVAGAPAGSGPLRAEQTQGFSVTGAFQHYFTPTIHGVVYGSYAEVEPGRVARKTNYVLGGLSFADEYRVGGQLIYTPVKGFDIGVDVMYIKLEQKLATTTGVPIAFGTNPNLPFAGVRVSPDAVEGRLRLQRSF